MPRHTSYRQGTPNWVDLRTPEPEAAKSFYGRLFGWTFDDRTTPRGAWAVKNDGLVAGFTVIVTSCSVRVSS
jgi:predicted enzyme related to lactoylglutathione lyase